MNTNQTVVKMVFDRWNALLDNCNTIFDSLSDEQMQKEIVPGRNRVIYLLGHLIAVHDDMIPILGFGEKLYPELHDIFIKSPDKTVSELPATQELRIRWSKINDYLTQKFESLSADNWFEKHNSVSAEDFAREPHRNKLNIILTRTTHLAYHVGQLKLIIND